MEIPHTQILFLKREKAALKKELDVEEGDIVFFAAAEWERACAILGRVRLEAAQLLVKPRHPNNP